MTAAIMMATHQSDASFCLLSQPDLAHAVNHLNELICPQAAQLDRFVSLAAVLIDPATHTVSIVSAGHMSPLLYRKATGTIEDAMSNNVTWMLLGIMESSSFEA